MRIRKPNKKKKTLGPLGVLLLALVVLVPLGGAGVGALYLMEDMEKPLLSLFPDIDAVSVKKEFTVKPRTRLGHQIRRGHRRPGLKNIPSCASPRRPAKIRSGESLLWKAELRGGEFDLQVVVTDGSFFNFGAGNSSRIDKRMTLDLSPRTSGPDATHYMRQGGVGLVIYTVSKDPERSGVMVGDRFFPGFKQTRACTTACSPIPGRGAEDYKPKLYARTGPETNAPDFS
jgi:hypothetical protein